MPFQASLICSFGRFQGSLSTDHAGVNYQANPSDRLHTSPWASSSCTPLQGEVAIQSCDHLSVLQMSDKLPEEARLCHSLSFLVRELLSGFLSEVCSEHSWKHRRPQPKDTSVSMESSSFHQQSNVNKWVPGLGKVHQLCWQGFPSHSLLGRY